MPGFLAVVLYRVLLQICRGWEGRASSGSAQSRVAERSARSGAELRKPDPAKEWD